MIKITCSTCKKELRTTAQLYLNGVDGYPKDSPAAIQVLPCRFCLEMARSESCQIGAGESTE